MRTRVVFPIIMLGLLLAVTCHAAISIPSDGSDGVFNPTSNVEIDLGQAANATWDTPSPVAGKGVYDGAKWAVVFKYSEVNIPSGVTVTFKNHLPNAPVVWLVSGNVTIDGTVSLDGRWIYSGVHAGYLGPVNTGGPGGYRGALQWKLGEPNWMSGMGPGGGVDVSAPGSYASGPYAYGSVGLVPLIGGSGGSVAAGGGHRSAGAGGGGAILVACANAISVSGNLHANSSATVGDWNQGSGSGGGIRLIADTYAVSGTVSAQSLSTAGCAGRLRVEAVNGSLSGSFTPLPSYGTPANPAQIWPDVLAPSVKVAQVAGLSVSDDPRAGFEFPNHDVSLTAEGTVAIRVEATNVPLDWLVKVRVGPLNNAASWATATMVPGGTLESSVWTADVQLPKGFTAIQARANKP